MKKIILTCLFSLLTFSFYGQNPPIITGEQNAVWVEELRQEKELEKQLEQLRERIIADSVIYYRATANPHGKDAVSAKDFEEVTMYRPIYVLTYPGGNLLVKPNPSEEYIPVLQKILQPQNVLSVKVTTGAKATAIYGARAIPGLIEIRVKNREVLADLKANNMK